VAAKNRIGIALLCVVVGLALMGAAYDKPEWYFMVLGIAGLLVCLGGPLWAVIHRRSL